MIGVYGVKVSFTRRFRGPDGIAYRVPGVWVLPFLKYLNCLSLFLKYQGVVPAQGNSSCSCIGRVISALI